MLMAALGTACAAFAADARQGFPPDSQTLTVLVYDYAGVSESSLDDMETLSAELLSRAGIRTHWVHCLRHQEGSRPPLCDANLDTGRKLLRILATYPGDPSKLGGDPLGMAVVENRYASVYASDIHKYADHHGLPAGTLLAYAVTHEIGHLLLGRSHSPTGIMRGAWGKADYRDMAQRWLGFGAAELQALRLAVPAEQRLARLK